MISRVLSLLLAVAAAACGVTPQPDVATVQAQLDSLLAVHAEHAVAKDIDGIMAGYTENAVVRSNHVEPLTGRAEIRQYISQVLDAVTIRSLRYHTDELAVHGDSAWQIGTFELTAQASAGPVQEDRGSFFALWLRDAGGTWRIHRDILNSSLPLAPASQQSGG